MDGLQRSAIEGGIEMSAYYSFGKPSMARAVILTEHRLDEVDTLVVTKHSPGFDRASIARLRQIVRQAGSGELGPLKFITFEFAPEATGSNQTAAAEVGFDALIEELSDLILKAPVVSVASAHGHMEGADLEFALACSMLIGEAGATFSFAGDPGISVNVYGFLAQKIGFVRAERLMEDGAVLDSEAMRELLLLKDVSERGSGPGAMEQFLRRTARRHNSCYGIYRAQRIATSAQEGRRASF